MNGDVTLDTMSTDGPVDRHRAAKDQHHFLWLRVSHRGQKRDSHLHLQRAEGH